MKVKELIEKLKNCDPNEDVVLSMDYSVLHMDEPNNNLGTANLKQVVDCGTMLNFVILRGFTFTEKY